MEAILKHGSCELLENLVAVRKTEDRACVRDLPLFEFWDRLLITVWDFEEGANKNHDKLEVYDYLERKTNHFDSERVHLILSEFLRYKKATGLDDHKVEIRAEDGTVLDFGYYSEIEFYPLLEFTQDMLEKKAEQQKGTSDKDTVMPAELNTEKANKYFKRAIDTGMMEVSGGGGRWLTGQARLGYFCLKVFEQPRPISELEKFFMVRKLSASITSASYEAKRADVIAWRNDIDNKIFFD